MNTFEIAKKALREYILANKDKVRQDLDKLRGISTGYDLNNYVENLAPSLAIQNANISKEVCFDIVSSDILNTLIEESLYKDYSPPKKQTYYSYKKDSEILSESFFLI